MNYVNGMIYISSSLLRIIMDKYPLFYIIDDERNGIFLRFNDTKVSRLNLFVTSTSDNVRITDGYGNIILALNIDGSGGTLHCWLSEIECDQFYENNIDVYSGACDLSPNKRKWTINKILK